MLALIAGGGDLPRRVAAVQDQAPLVCSLEGNRRPEGLDVDHWFRLETLGTLLLTLGEAGVSEICLCGSIDRPALDPAALDDETKPLVPLFMEALQKGDDGALRVVLSIFEQTGFTIRAAHELAPHLLPSPGVLTVRNPREGHRHDANAAEEVLAEMGRADLGQACVMRKGDVIARENETGTDAMLTALALDYERPARADEMMVSTGGLSEELATWLAELSGMVHDAPGAGAILYKAPKPGQDTRADLPTIGPGTAIRAAEAGLDGIVIKSGGVIVLDQTQTLAILDAMGMFLWVSP
ncbi:UDP-2,3-diacylglucosamine diphosphatase LpxI [Alisedimentitalea sp. MJ-SS2]|uniref:LpxI family protein n=1 Tax=Aliisedimentitalea sp. MJ-SS2 TaxID=3049795 RepID=UPI00290BE856|nr:UDP-2,3-diacylglucosamine diphosphatase LpxI [Alisedimentitalea sp. MJ-SS2]MDU8929766.1 UDP-2,3-diacylglucosamine diphosphatase LpxI [Alisedimentitalea sp. MJ-SS2]